MEEIIKDSSAESAVLGAILLDNSKLNTAELSDNDFYHEANKVIFKAINSLYSEGKGADIVTVLDALGNKAKDVGGMTKLLQLEQLASFSAVFLDHVAILKKKAKLRHIKAKALEAVAMCDNEADPDSILSTIQNISLNGESKGVRNLMDIFKENTKELEAKYESKEDIFGLATKFVDLDNMLGGLKPSDLIILAARPSMGKTALALNIASNIAVDQNKYVLVFSLEMSAGQLVNRVVSSIELIPGTHILQPKRLTEEEFSKYWDAPSLIEGKHLDIYDDPLVSPAKVRRIAKGYLAKNKHLDLILIDYLQLMVADKDYGNNKVQEVGDITRKLKILARELKVPIILLSQLNRSVDSRENHRPVMSDLRDSGNIEQDADVIIFLYRIGFYFPKDVNANVTEAIVAKHRNGPIGTVKLFFLNKMATFMNYQENE